MRNYSPLPLPQHHSREQKKKSQYHKTALSLSRQIGINMAIFIMLWNNCRIQDYLSVFPHRILLFQLIRRMALLHTTLCFRCGISNKKNSSKFLNIKVGYRCSPFSLYSQEVTWLFCLADVSKKYFINIYPEIRISI